MDNRAIQLTDEQMRDFIINGYIKVKTDFPASFHEHIYQQVDAMFEQTGNWGNNVLPLIPEIQQVFEHPIVHGAMQGVLGSNYMMPHTATVITIREEAVDRVFIRILMKVMNRFVGINVVGRWGFTIRKT